MMPLTQTKTPAPLARHVLPPVAVSPKVAAMRARMAELRAAGFDPSAALVAVHGAPVAAPMGGKARPIEWDGVKYPTIAAAARAARMNECTFRKRLVAAGVLA